jgi:hypothetical protein
MLEGAHADAPAIIDYTLNNKEWGRIGNRDAVNVPRDLPLQRRRSMGRNQRAARRSGNDFVR